MILIYDSECTLCTRFKKSLEILDFKKKMRFVAVNDLSIYLEYPELNKDECEEVVHFIDDGRIYKGSDAITKLLEHYPGVSKFSWLLNSDSGKKTMNAFYQRLNFMRTSGKAGCSKCGQKKKRCV